MNITFQESELASFLGKVEKWHEDKFKFVVTKMFENFDPYQFCGRMPLGGRSDYAVAERVREFIAKFETQFEKDNPKPNWKDFL
jgi:hypothetical protein